MNKNFLKFKLTDSISSKNIGILPFGKKRIKIDNFDWFRFIIIIYFILLSFLFLKLNDTRFDSK